MTTDTREQTTNTMLRLRPQKIERIVGRVVRKDDREPAVGEAVALRRAPDVAMFVVRYSVEIASLGRQRQKGVVVTADDSDGGGQGVDDAEHLGRQAQQSGQLRPQMVNPLGASDIENDQKLHGLLIDKFREFRCRVLQLLPDLQDFAGWTVVLVGYANSSVRWP